MELLLKGARALLPAATLAAIVAVALAWTAIGPARAGMVTTETVIEAGDPAGEADAARDDQRERVRAFMKRAEVRERLEALGVDPDEAAARAESLSDVEIALISGKLDELPAGTAAVGLETLLVILVVVLLIVILI